MFRTPLVGSIARTALRFKVGADYLKTPVGEWLRWLVRSREITNFTYDLDPLNRRYLAAFVSHVTGAEADRVLDCFSELEEDESLRRHIETVTRQRPQRRVADDQPRYGRRIGWYAVVRMLKPKVVVETGVDKGLGACVLTAALRRNERDGYPGYYYGTDRHPRAGYLLTGEYARHGRILYGDSIESLRTLDGAIDLFINDSDHRAEYEAAEYQTIRDKLSPGAIVLGDNAHVTDTLLRFAEDTGRRFLFFQEKPRQHWYPGAGIGAAFPALVASPAAAQAHSRACCDNRGASPTDQLPVTTVS